MPAASRKDGPVTAAEAEALLAPLGVFEAVALAVSGGSELHCPDEAGRRMGRGASIAATACRV